VPACALGRDDSVTIRAPGRDVLGAMYGIGVVGTSYRHASSEQIARFAIPRAEVESRLPQLRQALRGAEVLYLATCNRVEVVFALADGPARDRRSEVFRALLGREPHDGEAAATLRTWTGEAAIEHLFLVACGLDSAQAGEQEIYVQLRAAWQAARAAGTAGPLLDRIVSESLAMARQAHRLKSHDAPSLADLAADCVVAHVAPGRAHGAAHPVVALIGVSPMTRRCGSRLAARGLPLLVVNRSREAADELASTLGARAVTLDAFRRDPPEGCAALVCAAGSSEAVLDRTALERLTQGATQGRTRPLIVDFGLPPNVDPDAARAVGLERIDIDSLVRTAREERVAHLVRLAPVRAAIDERLARLRGELAARAIGPQLAHLRAQFEQIVAAEVERLLKGELQDLDAARRVRLADWATTLAHRLAHLPLSGMRAAAEHASLEATEAFFREARLHRGGEPSAEKEKGS
jgi:glutamyl-tRNA reductase